MRRLRASDPLDRGLDARGTPGGGQRGPLAALPGLPWAGGAARGARHAERAQDELPPTLRKPVN